MNVYDYQMKGAPHDPITNTGIWYSFNRGPRFKPTDDILKFVTEAPVPWRGYMPRAALYFSVIVNGRSTDLGMLEFKYNRKKQLCVHNAKWRLVPISKYIADFDKLIKSFGDE